MTAPPMPPPGSEVDRDNPWPGLSSFTEDLKGFFFGREKETEELVRLVRRNTLTVLFGQSGLGKSSLLQAGVFPVLRTADFLPLYLRLDHDPSTPALADQVKVALVEAFKAAGADAPAPRPDESLWEYFHRKDIDIWSSKNRLLTPVLAFDQFEEIFTLGRADEGRRERGRAFLAELADLVENRAPAALREKFDSGELDTARYAFDKPSCQVILSLREDFLPDLEGLKNDMRSLMHSRMRVRRLTGTQALEIVTRPAPHLLADGVAERVVEFVAGGRGGSAERLAEMEVEPALLSVICRELNQRRRALGQAQITIDLVSGNRREILNDFYERSVSDLPPAMREFVEDHLLTKSGFRDNLALETALEAPGVTRPLLDTLVSRRLLRIEDRLGVQRVELTHDVLADVIRASRDSRREREGREAAEVALAGARSREAKARRSAVRALLIAAGSAAMAAAAIAAAAWGFVNLKRARAAEGAALHAQADAQISRQQADSARREAEQLLTYLLWEFGRKLFESGQLGLVEQLSRRTVDYYDHLPPGLVTGSTDRNHALSLALLGNVFNRQNRNDEAGKLIGESIADFRRLVRAGDRSIETAEGFSLALQLQADWYGNQAMAAEARRSSRESVSVLRPFMADPKARDELRPKLAEALMALAWADFSVDLKDSQKDFAETATLYLEAGGADPKNEGVAAAYSVALKGLAFGAEQLDRDLGKARRLIEQAIALQDAILRQSPSRLQLLQERAGAHQALANILYEQGKLTEALVECEKSDRDYESYLQQNPTDNKIRQYATETKDLLAAILRDFGRLSEARAIQRTSLAESGKRAMSPEYALNLAFGYWDLAESAADEGDRKGAEEALNDCTHYLDLWSKGSPAGGEVALAAAQYALNAKARVDFSLEDSPADALAEAREILADLLGMPTGGFSSRVYTYHLEMLADSDDMIVAAALELGQFSEAEVAAEQEVNSLQPVLVAPNGTTPVLEMDYAKKDLAAAVAGQGRHAEARAIIDPIVSAARVRVAASSENMSRRSNLADMLLVQEAAQEPASREKRQSLLNEARSLMDELPEEMKATQSHRRSMARLAAEQAKLDSKP